MGDFETLKCKLTASEAHDRAFTLAQTTQKMADTEDEKKAAMADFKDRIDGYKGEAKRLAGIVTAGEEPRTVEVRNVLSASRKKVDTVRLDTGEVVRTRMAREDELQLAMPLEEGATGDLPLSPPNSDQPEPCMSQLEYLTEQGDAREVRDCSRFLGHDGPHEAERDDDDEHPDARIWWRDGDDGCKTHDEVTAEDEDDPQCCATLVQAEGPSLGCRLVALHDQEHENVEGDEPVLWTDEDDGAYTHEAIASYFAALEAEADTTEAEHDAAEAADAAQAEAEGDDEATG